MFIRGAFKQNPDECKKIIERYEDVEKEGKAFAQHDYQMHHDLAFASNNPVYVLMMNGFKGLYARIGGYFFSHESAREVATDYYKQLLEVLETQDSDRVIAVVRRYGVESGKIWQLVRQDMPSNIAD